MRAYYSEALAGRQRGMSVRPTSFREVGDQVVVNGSVRVDRASGGFSESQLSWTYRFRDGLVVEAEWGPREQA